MTPDPWNRKLFNQRLKAITQEFGKDAIEIHLPALWSEKLKDHKGFKVFYSTVNTIQIRVTSVNLVLMMEMPQRARH